MMKCICDVRLGTLPSLIRDEYIQATFSTNFSLETPSRDTCSVGRMGDDVTRGVILIGGVMVGLRLDLELFKDGESCEFVRSKMECVLIFELKLSSIRAPDIRCSSLFR